MFPLLVGRPSNHRRISLYNDSDVTSCYMSELHKQGKRHEVKLEFGLIRWTVICTMCIEGATTWILVGCLYAAATCEMAASTNGTRKIYEFTHSITMSGHDGSPDICRNVKYCSPEWRAIRRERNKIKNTNVKWEPCVSTNLLICGF